QGLRQGRHPPPAGRLPQAVRERRRSVRRAAGDRGGELRGPAGDHGDRRLHPRGRQTSALPAGRMSRLGLIAGGGALPMAVAARCEAEGRPVFVVRLSGFADPHLARYPGIEAGLAEIGKVLAALKKAGCDAVCFAGLVSRPDFKSLKPDFKGMTLLPGIIAEAAKGDDALLRKILSLFEAEGYAVQGADDILGGETLPAGALGAITPTSEQMQDLKKAIHVAEKSGELDIGQGAVVCDGLVLAVEAQE